MPNNPPVFQTTLAEPTIDDLLRRSAPFVVPKYQRSFSWDSEEICDFIKDLNALSATYRPEMGSGDPPKRHFLGSIVCANAYGDQNERNFLLIDGQQRLATLTLTLNLIAKALKDLSNIIPIAEDSRRELLRERKKILKRYIYLPEDIDDEEFEGDGRTFDIIDCPLRLKLSKADNSFYNNLIKDLELFNERASHQRLIDATDSLKKELIIPIISDTDLDIDEKKKKLLVYKNCILHDFFVIHIVCNSAMNAYRIFDTLNNRGKALSDGDLLRSRSLEALERYPEKQEVIENEWNEILSFKPNEIDDFLRFYYTSFAGRRPPMYRFSEKFYEEIFSTRPISNQREASKLMEKIRALNNESKIYNNLLIKGEWPYEESTIDLWKKDRLKRLIIVLDHTLCIPLLLSSKSKLSEGAFYELIHNLEKFVFRYKTVCNARVQKLAEKYYENAKLIRDTPRSFDLNIFKQTLNDLLEENANDSTFEINLSNLTYKKSSNKKNKQILHFLTTLEDYYIWYSRGCLGIPSINNESLWDLSVVDIEHIYPQTPQRDNVLSTLEPLKQNIGNLTFLAQNENRNLRLIGNKPFLEKKEAYSNSRVRLTRDLAELETWTDIACNERQNELIAMAKKIFIIVPSQ